MADLLFVGQFIASKAGKTGLTVTVDVDRYTLADGSRTALVTAGSATEGRRGLYHYRLASADLATYQYVATFITADATVDQQEIAALGIVVPDALVGSRLAPAVAGRTLDVDASGNAAANVTHQAGVAVAAADANGNVPVIVKAWYDTLVPEPDTAGYPDVGTVSNMSLQVSQQVRDAMKLAPSGGAAAAGSVDAHLDAVALETTAQAILEDTSTTLPALIGGLSGATVTVVSSVDGGTVTVYAADTWRFTVLSAQLALADYETLGLIVKRSARQADTQALLYLRTDTGLVRMDGAAPVSAGNGTLTKTATSFTAVVHVAETQGLAPGGYRWWLKGLDTTPAPDEAVTLATGEFVVLAAGLQAVV